jgi:PAS domain S-box-containing protein
MAIVSPDRYCLDVNDELCSLLGYEREELLGVRWTDITHPDDLAADVARFDRVLAGESDGYALDKRWIRKDGAVVHTTISVRRLRHADASVDCIVAVLEDVPERKRAEEALRQAHEESERRVAERTQQLAAAIDRLTHEVAGRIAADEALHQARAELMHATRALSLGELTTSLAHEFNQPLAAIVTNGEAGLRWLATEVPNLVEARQAVGRIVREANRASEILQRIRALLTKSTTEREWLDTTAVVDEVVKLIRPEAERHRVALEARLASDLPRVLGARVELQQVVLNLVMNGLEALSEAAGDPRTLEVRSERHELEGQPGVLLAVEDTGPGVPGENAERIFEAFYSTKPNGLGMGLPISRSIVETLGGRLWLAPRADSGARFRCFLPSQR